MRGDGSGAYGSAVSYPRNSLTEAITVICIVLPSADTYGTISSTGPSSTASVVGCTIGEKAPPVAPSLLLVPTTFKSVRTYFTFTALICACRLLRVVTFGAVS